VATVVAIVAGWTDWRSRRIPNWLTLPGILLGIAVNAVAFGWPGARASVLGAALGLGLLLPFVMIRALGAGDWKLIGAIGAAMGPHHLLEILWVTILINGVMAAVWVVAKGRMRETLRNLGRMLAALSTFHLPGADLTLENPEAVKVPFGVAAAIAVMAYAGAHAIGGL
jgi:prepilin peptidase CpaA